MFPRILCILGLSFATACAADSSPEELLRRGLFEEEANRDLDKATASYQAVIEAHNQQRAFAATATFRLGEIARKKNDKEAAAAAFRTVAERFPEQTELARISRENLAALGSAPAIEAPSGISDPEQAEIARLKEIARNSPDLIDGAGPDGWRPIHHAAAKGWTRVLSYLLENKADPNSRTIAEKLTPLQLASIHGYLSTAKALMASKADINATFEIKACPEGLLPVADRDTKSAYGDWTALDLAILYNRSEIARALIDAGADIKRDGPAMIPGSSRRDGLSNHFTTLELAIFLKRNDLAGALIEAGSPIEPMDNKNRSTPLRLAVTNNPEMVAPLLKAGADPKLAKDAERFTPLHFAAMRSGIESAKLLLEAGADVNARDAEEKTPLHWAFTPEMVELLVSKGADPNAKDKSASSPLDVAASDGSHPAVIESLLKHGAKVEDPIALLQRCSETNLPVVRERIVYPREQRPDAILLSVTGDHSFNPPPTADRQTRFVVPPRSSQSRPDLVTLETRPTPANPPPSLAEALCEAYDAGERLLSVRIVRRDANQTFETVREWTFTENSSLPKDWPALQWGDIVEVRTTNTRYVSQGPPVIGELATLIPNRSVTFRIGDLEIPKTIPGNRTFWLDRNSSRTLPKLIPNIEKIADLDHFVIHRKGAPEPIKLDFTQATGTRFRMIDGDVVELSLNLPELYRQFGEGDSTSFISLTGDSGQRGSGETNLARYLANFPVTPPIDFHKILILRRAENWKPEIVDLKAWLDSLPPSDQWNKDALEPIALKLNPGDLFVIVRDPAENAERSATEIRGKLQSIDKFLTGPRRARPAIMPPSAPPR